MNNLHVITNTQQFKMIIYTLCNIFDSVSTVIKCRHKLTRPRIKNSCQNLNKVSYYTEHQKHKQFFHTIAVNTMRVARQTILHNLNTGGHHTPINKHKQNVLHKKIIQLSVFV